MVECRKPTKIDISPEYFVGCDVGELMANLGNGVEVSRSQIFETLRPYFPRNFTPPIRTIIVAIEFAVHAFRHA